MKLFKEKGNNSNADYLLHSRARVGNRVDEHQQFLPFLLQGSEVLLEGRADLAQELHQWMAQEAGIGWLGVKGVSSRSGKQTHTQTI